MGSYSGFVKFGQSLILRSPGQHPSFQCYWYCAEDCGLRALIISESEHSLNFFGKQPLSSFDLNFFFNSRDASLKNGATFHSESEDLVASSLNWENPSINDHLVAPSDFISSEITFPSIPNQMNPAALLLSSLSSASSVDSYQDSGQATPVLSSSSQDSPDSSLSIAVTQPWPIPLDRPQYLECRQCSQKFASRIRLRSVAMSRITDFPTNRYKKTFQLP